MTDIKNDWSYPVMETTLDKRLERPGVQRGYASEMTGVDGRSEGGLKPFPGFKKVYTLSGLQSQPNHTIKSVVSDLKAVDFRIGSDHYAYGFVYRAIRPAAPTLSDVFLDYWDSVNQSWTQAIVLMSGVSISAQFDVQVAGRFVYCFAEGRSPSLFYIEATRTKEYICEADAFVNSAAATTNYESIQPLTLELISGSSTKNIFLRFDTSAETNELVESAILEFTVTGNSITAASGTLHVAPLSDPGTTAVLWNEAQTTWNLRATAVNWSTAGGSYEAGHEINYTLLKNYLGKVQLSTTNIVQRAVNGLSQAFTRKTDVIVRGTTGNTLVSLAGKSQSNYSIRPKLVVTYTNKVFLTPTIIGVTGTGSIPGPGKQPSLSSPERGIAPGSFTSLDAGRPSSAQIVLISDNPYSSDNFFPNQATGICYNDTVPSPAVVTPPGSPYTHTPTAGACTGYTSTGLITQLLTPANKQTSVSVTPKLDWTTYYTTGQSIGPNTRWDVYMVEDGQGILSQKRLNTIDLTETSFEPANLFPNLRLAYGKKYLWKVVAKRMDCADFYVESTVGSFTTENRYQARKFEPGDYSFGYVLGSSKTGRKSAFSTVAQVRSEDFTIARTQNGNTISVKQDQYVGVEIVYDSAKYDQMYVYRSVKIQDAGGTMVAGLPFLDAIVRLSDYHTCLNGTGRTFGDATTNRHAMYFYELEDKQLVYQNAYVDRSVFDETMPFAGTAFFYQNTMLTSKISTPQVSTTEENRISDSTRGLGEMRWSSLMDLTPELFPPFNRYNPTVPSNEIIRFSGVGSNVLGFSRDKVYHLRKSGPYVKVTEMHEGYGIVNQKAVDTVGSAAYYVTSHGLKSVDGQGQLDEIRNLNTVFVREWKNTLQYVQVVHDPFMNCLFIHNPVREETYILWFSTGKTTKLEDTNFDLVAQGSWPIQWLTDLQASNDLSRRAFFLQNNQDPRVSGVGFNTFTGPTIYIVDNYGFKSVVNGSSSWNGQRRITTLDFEGDSRFVASANWDPTNLRIPITSATGTVVGTNNWRFAYVYLVASPTNPSLVGSKAKVLHNTSTGVYVQNTGSQAWVTSIVAGDIFVVSPVPFEWVGHPLGLSNEQGLIYSNADFFRMKIVSSLGASFSDVSGPPITDVITTTSPLDRFSAVIYSGTQDLPLATALTKETNGTLYSSVEDDEGLVYAAFGSDSSDGRYGVKGTTLSPGIKILCPDLDFRLLGCIVRGSITSVERTSNNRGS